MKRNRFCDLLCIEHPIVEAPIGSATCAELAAAVSNAGALGTISITWRTHEQIERLLARTRERTRCPIGANLVLVQPQEERASLALEAGVPVLWTSWGHPGAYVRLAHARDAVLLHTVGCLDEALAAVEAGVDVLVLQGSEAGGHVLGKSPALELLARVRDRVELPLVVAGGIANGADLARALDQGASGVSLGTRFLCSEEANAAPIYQQAILDAAAGDTLLTGLFDKGWPDAPHRVLRNSTVRAWEQAGCPASGARPGEDDVVARSSRGTAIRRYSDVMPTKSLTGDLEALALYAGTTAARVHDVRPAAEIVRELVGGADAGSGDRAGRGR